MKLNTPILLPIIIGIVISLLPIPSLADAVDNQHPKGAQNLALGKMNLDRGEMQPAIDHLSQSIEALPLLADYALYWRAIAYERLKEHDRALKDLQRLKEQYKESPLIKNARIKELEILKKTSEELYMKAAEGFMKDYPSEYAVKFTYAMDIKALGKNERALKILKDVFINSTNNLASKALREIGENNLTVEDLIKKANNLNKAWYFSEAERYFKEALKRDKRGIFRSAIKEGLAYSYFRQKRYKESAELYRERGDQYWYGRSLLRARDIPQFENNLRIFKRGSDKRMLSLLIAYGNIKRRNGDPETAIELFNGLMQRQLDKQGLEAVLWALGWTYYLERDYDKALPIFTRLKDQYGDPKYLYWLRRIEEQISKTPEEGKVQDLKVGYRDYYGYLMALKYKIPVTGLQRVYKSPLIPQPLRRAEILYEIGLKAEATSEAIHSVRISGAELKAPAASYFLNRIGNYRYSVNIISKTPYTEEYHNLLYPFVYMEDIEDVAKTLNLDPLLILSIIREESRYDPEARSIAGALGLMQLMPSTARLYEKASRVTLGSTTDLYEPRKNILIGAHYFKHLINLFGALAPAIASYNAGEEPVKEWLKRGQYTGVDEFIEDIPYDETNNYVKKVLTTYFEYLRAKDAPLPETGVIGVL